MNASEFIVAYATDSVEFISFKWNGKHANEMIDDNLHFRREVIKYLESINYKNIHAELLRDLLVAESQYAKEAWGIYRHYNLLVENLVRQTGTIYLDDLLKSASLSFDTYCSTLAAELTGIDIDEIIIEINSRRTNIKEENMLKVYDLGIKIFSNFKSKQSIVSDDMREGKNTFKPSIFKKLLRIIRRKL